ncbi:hypothetical protein D3C76_1501510 [compost metagenome]
MQRWLKRRHPWAACGTGMQGIVGLMGDVAVTGSDREIPFYGRPKGVGPIAGKPAPTDLVGAGMMH